MATATATKEKAPNQSAINTLIDEFLREYSAAFTDAMKAKETTDQAAWQEMYAGETRAQRETDRSLGEDLAIEAKYLTEGMFTEENGKEIGEIKKAATQNLDRRTIFSVNTVGPLREPVTRCHETITDYRSKAANHEERAPLVFKGVQDAMNEAIRGVDGVKWDNRTGRILVHHEPK